MKNKALVLIFASLGLLSCSSSTEPTSDQVNLSPDRGSYVSGGEIIAQLANDGSAAIGFSWCDLTVERQDPAGWTTLPPAPRVCQLMLNILNPGQREEAPLAQDSPLPPATYRLLLPVGSEESSDIRTIHSAPFTVAAD